MNSLNSEEICSSFSSILFFSAMMAVTPAHLRGNLKAMRIYKSSHEIRSVEDWFEYAPPKKGERHWKDGRSAKELASRGLETARRTLQMRWSSS